MPRMERIRWASANAPGEGGIGEIISFALGLLRRRYLIIIVTAALALSLAIAYTVYARPTYTAQTQILLSNPKAQFVRQESLLAEPAFDLTEIETQIQMLKSSGIATAVIKQLNLTEDRDFNSATLSLASIWRNIQDRVLPLHMETSHQRSDESLEGLIDAFEDRLQVHRVGVSNIIEISYSSASAARAAEIANAVANTYLKDQLSSKFEATHLATGWLKERLQELDVQARAAEHAVDVYETQHNIVSSGGRPIGQQQISDFNSRLVMARTQTADALARLEQYQAILHAYARNTSSSDALGAAVAGALSSPIINNLRTQYLQLARRESEWAAQFGKKHLAVVNLRTQMREIKKSIRDEVSRLAATSQSDYDVALARQQEIKKQLGEAVSKSRASDSAEIALRDMKTKAKTYRDLYETFQHRYMGAMQQNSFPILEARVIYPALPPDRTSKPNERLILALGAFGGLAFGLAMGLLKDMMDRSVRTPAHVENALQLPCLSVVPRTRAPKALKADRIEVRRLTVDACQQVVLTGNSIDSTVVCMPMSRFAETIRSVKMGIDLNPIKTANRVIGVISALPHEGKTTIASSLVQLIAHSGKRAIIVDCDLKKPSLSASLAPNVTLGIIEVVSGASLLEDAICRDVTTGFDLLPVARRNPMFHTNEVLASDKMRRLFDQLRAVYDYVIVDLPPLSPVVDARAAALFTDCFVLVIEWGRTKIDVVQHALNTAPNVYENIAGVVLNKTDFNRMGHYDSSLRDYYDESHYARYAVADKP